MNTEIAKIHINIPYEDDATYLDFLNFLDRYECGICEDNSFISGRHAYGEIEIRHVRMYVSFPEEEPNCVRVKDGLAEILGETAFIFDSTCIDAVYFKLQFRGNKFAGPRPIEDSE